MKDETSIQMGLQIKKAREKARLTQEQLSEILLLDFPTRVLCSEDCKGLCHKCGKDLNEGDCGCDHREIDPRFAVLQQLLDQADDSEK